MNLASIVAYRFASWDTPLWINENRSEARFNRVGDPPTQYLCLHPLGPHAELLRSQGIRDAHELADVRMRT